LGIIFDRGEIGFSSHAQQNISVDLMANPLIITKFNKLLALK